MTDPSPEPPTDALCENCYHPLSHHDKDGKCEHWMYVFYDTPACNCRIRQMADDTATKEGCEHE